MSNQGRVFAVVGVPLRVVGKDEILTDAVQLASICEPLGAGEILLNCIDKDGTISGFDRLWKR